MLDDFNLSLLAGKVTALCGLSGAGETLLILCVSNMQMLHVYVTRKKQLSIIIITIIIIR